MNPELTHATLDHAEYLMREGRVSIADVREYLEAWNATPGRFTFAEIDGPDFAPRITQHDRCGDCGLIRREHGGAAHRFVV